MVVLAKIPKNHITTLLLHSRVKTTIITASQVGDGLMRMDHCYFHQTATLNMCVFLFLLLFSQKTNVTIGSSVKFSFRIIFYLNFEKNGLLLFSQRTLQLKNRLQKKLEAFSKNETILEPFPVPLYLLAGLSQNFRNQGDNYFLTGLNFFRNRRKW